MLTCYEADKNWYPVNFQQKSFFGDFFAEAILMAHTRQRLNFVKPDIMTYFPWIINEFRGILLNLNRLSDEVD